MSTAQLRSGRRRGRHERRDESRGCDESCTPRAWSVKATFIWSAAFLAAGAAWHVWDTSLHLPLSWEVPLPLGPGGVCAACWALHRRQR